MALRLPRRTRWPAAQKLLTVLAVALLVAGCAASNDEAAETEANSTPVSVSAPERCRGDGAVQTWLLLPVEPPNSNLMDAYRSQQVIEFQAQVVGAKDDVARTPHRAFVLGEVAEGITLTLDYQGDPPPLVLGQPYRIVAWTFPAASTAAQSTPLTEATVQADPLQARASLEDFQSYELQVFDEAGLLFLGATDVELQDDPLGIVLEDADGECPTVPAPNNECVAGRQVRPLRVRWGEETITLYPGEDGELRHAGQMFRISLFRNRSVQYNEPPCPGYFEHQRSLRIERLDPPPVVVPLPTLVTTATVTGTAPTTLTVTAPVTQTEP